MIVDLEYPVGDALQTSLQNGDRGAQFVGDLGVPGDAFFGVRLKPLRHSVEVFDQLGGFAKGAFADGSAGRQIALGNPLRRDGQGGERQDDLTRQECAGQDGQSDRRQDQCSNDRIVDGLGLPVVRRGDRAGIIFKHPGIDEEGAERAEDEAGQGDQADPRRHIAPYAVGQGQASGSSR